jgi:hypothetical protein
MHLIEKKVLKAQELELLNAFQMEELEERLEMSDISKLWHRDMEPPEQEHYE